MRHARVKRGLLAVRLDQHVEDVG